MIHRFVEPQKFRCESLASSDLVNCINDLNGTINAARGIGADCSSSTVIDSGIRVTKQQPSTSGSWARVVLDLRDFCAGVRLIDSRLEIEIRRGELVIKPI